MSTAELFTYGDAIAAMDDFTQGHLAGHPMTSLRRNILAAYREFAATHDWSFLLYPGRIQLVKAQATGTVVFDLTGGATAERQLTLTGATFPENVADYSIRFDDIVCDVETRYSDTVVSLDTTMSPGADVDSTTYTLWPRYYQLPIDFASMARTQDETTSWLLGQYLPMADLHAYTRYDDNTGDARYYSVGPVPDLHGIMGLYVHPASDTAKTLDFLFKRKPRQLRYTGKDENDKAGTITMTSGSTALTGSGTAFASTHVGSIIRTAGNSTLPTGIEGDNPWVEQRSIVAVASATSATLDANPSITHTAKKYTISDPIDLMPAAYEAFLWLAKKNLATERRMKDVSEIERAYQNALSRAKAGDSRTMHRRVAGPGMIRVRRLRDRAINRGEVT